jgi:cytidylate kinase
MRAETRRFYKTFYWIDLDDRQLDDILLTATRQPMGKKY